MWHNFVQILSIKRCLTIITQEVTFIEQDQQFKFYIITKETIKNFKH